MPPSLLHRCCAVFVAAAVVLGTSACGTTPERSLHQVGPGKGLDLAVFVDQVDAARQARATSRAVSAPAFGRAGATDVRYDVPDDLAFIDVGVDGPLAEARNDGDGLPGEEFGAPAGPIAIDVESNAAAEPAASTSPASPEAPSDSGGEASAGDRDSYASQPTD